MRWPRKKLQLVAAAAAAMLIALTIAFGLPALEDRLRRQLVSAAEEACAPCRLEVARARVAFFPLTLEFAQLRFAQGDPRDSAVSAEAAGARIPLPFWANLRRGSWRLGRVEVSQLSVLLQEGDSSFPKAARARAASEAGPGFEFGGLLAGGARFRYRKDSPGGAAWLEVSAIDAKLEPFASTKRPLELHARAHARLEESGEVELFAEARPLEANPWVNVDLRVRGQVLREVNPYFRVEEGVSLAGQLIEARGLVQLRGEKAEGSLLAKYEGLAIKFHAGHRRGALSALLQSFGANVKVTKGNSREPRAERESGVVTRRHAKESVVGFLLRTLKEAAFRVAT